MNASIRRDAFVNAILVLCIATGAISGSNFLPPVSAVSTIPSPLDSSSPHLDVVVVTDRRVYDSGAPVVVTVRVKNLGSEQVSLVFPSSCQSSFSIEDAAHQARFAEVQACLMILGGLTLPPGQAMAYQFIWDQRGDDGRQQEPGMYWVRGFLLDRDPPDYYGYSAIWIGAQPPNGAMHEGNAIPDLFIPGGPCGFPSGIRSRPPCRT